MLILHSSDFQQLFQLRLHFDMIRRTISLNSIVCTIIFFTIFRFLIDLLREREMSNANTLNDARTLIATVVRAFYTDTHIVVMDLFLRESMVLAEQVGPRLRLRMKDLEKVLRELESHMMIKYEDVKNLQTGDTFRYYYIDYQICVMAIFYRIYRMKERLNEAERQQIRDVYYLCPTCDNQYSILQVQMMLSKDFQFICSSCCPEDDFRDCNTRDYPECKFKLKEIDNTHLEVSLQRTKRNLEAQLSTVEGQHRGILELLASSNLRRVPLPRNLPSENIKLGQGTSTVQDADVKEEINDQMNNMASGRSIGKSYINNRKRAATTQYIRDEQGLVIGVQAATANERRQMMEENIRTGNNTTFGNPSGGLGGTGGRSGGLASAADYLLQQQRDEITKRNMADRNLAVPDFLRQSGVLGAEESIRQASSLQWERQQMAQRLAQQQQQQLSSAMPLAAVATTVGVGAEVERIRFDSTNDLDTPTNLEEQEKKRRRLLEEQLVAGSMPGAGIAAAAPVQRGESGGMDMDDIAWED